MRYVLAVLAATSLALGAAGSSAESWDTPDAKWRQGPVKYLLTKEEDQAYKKLKTDEERSQFVTEFWARRDPSPGTPDNEYRDAFYVRARQAASEFTDEGGKGWQDDRGKVYILMGPPDNTVEGTSLAGGADGAGSAGTDLAAAGAAGRVDGMPGASQRPEATTKTLKWIYNRDPATQKEQRVEVNFVSDVTGGFRLQDRLDWNSPFLKGLEHPAAPPAAPPKAAAPPAASPAAPTPPPIEQAPPVQEVTPQADLLAAIKSAADTVAAIPLDVTVNFYKAADSSTFATLTLEVKRAALAPEADIANLIIAAEIVDAETGASAQRFLKREHFGAHEGNAGAAAAETLLFQAERPLKPGRYRAVFALKDPATGTVGKLEKDLAVPSFEGDDLLLSTVTLARQITPLASPPAAGTMTPYVLGSFTVVPRPDNVYKEGEELSFYFQVYGAKPDAVTNAPRLDLSYAFEKSVAGQWKMVGGKPLLTPGQSGLVQAFSLPLARWPSGDYRVAIKVTDTVAAKSASAEIPFTIVSATAPSKAKAKSKG
ncbi:MAG TPA: GWxTD domain-containing protein [Candidatus Polarisedimenticolia bacterium]|nr:GWxTD domain-containing protein [Candidatus Polarisedimenticolia bacterium]